MSELSEAFRAHAPQALRGAEVGAALEALAARGALAWPQLALAPSALVAQAARHLPAELGPAELSAALEGLHAADLHLACACAAGSPAALSSFESTLLGAPALGAAIARINGSAAFVDEVRQSVREKLLLARPGSAPRIADYSGRWPLASWLRTIAVRAAVDLRRGGGAANAPSPDGSAADQLAAQGDSPELGYLKLRYGASFQAAIGAAIGALDDEQANLLRLQAVDGLRTAQIAALFQVDRSTIKRRLASCREQVLAATRKHLGETLRLSPSEFESLAGLLRSQLHVSLARILKRG